MYYPKNEFRPLSNLTVDSVVDNGRCKAKYHFELLKAGPKSESLGLLSERVTSHALSRTASVISVP